MLDLSQGLNPIHTYLWQPFYSHMVHIVISAKQCWLVLGDTEDGPYFFSFFLPPPAIAHWKRRQQRCIHHSDVIADTLRETSNPKREKKAWNVLIWVSGYHFALARTQFQSYSWSSAFAWVHRKSQDALTVFFLFFFLNPKPFPDYFIFIFCLCSASFLLLPALSPFLSPKLPYKATFLFLILCFVSRDDFFFPSAL